MTIFLLFYSMCALWYAAPESYGKELRTSRESSFYAENNSENTSAQSAVRTYQNTNIFCVGLLNTYTTGLLNGVL